MLKSIPENGVPKAPLALAVVGMDSETISFYVRPSVEREWVWFIEID